MAFTTTASMPIIKGTIMERTTKTQLQFVVDRINTVTGSPTDAYSVNPETGRHNPNIGNYHLSSAYGGVCLHRMHNEGGGISSPLSTGHISKRELLNLMQAYLCGLMNATSKATA